MFVHVMAAPNPTFVASATYAPCSNCNEGALTWDPVAETSRCGTCEEPYVPAPARGDLDVPADD